MNTSHTRDRPTCPKHPTEPLFEELTEDRRRIRLSCLACVAEQILPEWERRHRERLEKAKKETEWDNLKDVALSGAIIGALLGFGVGHAVGDPGAGALIGAGAGAAWMVIEVFQARDRALAMPVPTVEQIREFIKDRPEWAAREVAAFKGTLRRQYALEASGIADADRMTGGGV